MPLKRKDRVWHANYDGGPLLECILSFGIAVVPDVYISIARSLAIMASSSFHFLKRFPGWLQHQVSPRRLFEYMITLAFLTKKNAKLPESQRLESSDHTRVTQHRYLSSTMNLSTKQNSHYRSQAASWSTGRLGIGCNDLPKITSSSKRCAFCGGILAPARIHIAGIPWKTEPTGVMAWWRKGWCVQNGQLQIPHVVV